MCCPSDQSMKTLLASCLAGTVSTYISLCSFGPFRICAIGIPQKAPDAGDVRVPNERLENLDLKQAIRNYCAVCSAQTAKWLELAPKPPTLNN